MLYILVYGCDGWNAKLKVKNIKMTLLVVNMENKVFLNIDMHAETHTNRDRNIMNHRHTHTEREREQTVLSLRF